MYKIFTRDLMAKQKPQIDFPQGFRLGDHVHEIEKAANGHRIYEFIGTDTFGTEWSRRRQYEVDAGRAEEPILYTPLYEITSNSALPKNVDVSTIGPGGVVFEEVKEGGEVQFSTITSGQYTIGIRHWATGLEYSKDLVIYNELWNVGLTERAMGIAHNALLNHLHFGPILTYTYTAANQTPATNVSASYLEELMFTLEAAISASRGDATNPRRGPYVLLCGSDMVFALERMMTRTPQVGFSVQSPSALDAVRSVIVYDGWSGTRGYSATTYAGVTAGKSYLISQQYRGQDFRSFEKQALSNEGTETDISRFLTQTVWDSYYGVYANPLRSVEEITVADQLDYQRLRNDTGHSLVSLPDPDAAALFAYAEELYGVGSAAVYPGTRELVILELLGNSAKLHDYQQNNSRESASQVYRNLKDQLAIWEKKRQEAVDAEATVAAGGSVRFGRSKSKPSRWLEYPDPSTYMRK